MGWSLKRHIRAAALAALLALPTLASAAPADDLNAVIARYWDWYLQSNPLLASSIGDRRFDTEIDDLSLAAQDRQAAQASAFAKELDAIPERGLAPADRIDRAILRRMLGEQAEANRYPERMIMFNSLGSWHQQFADLGSQLPFRTKADYESYLARLEKYPALNAQVIAISRAALKAGVVQPCVTLEGFEKTITGLIVSDPRQSRSYEPLTRQRPADMSAAEWEAAKARASTIIVTVLNPQNQQLLAFYKTEYQPKCRSSVGVAALPQGKDYYAFRARAMTTTDMTPEAIHQLGLKEVARIRTEMDRVAAKAGYASRAAFIRKLHDDPAYYAKSPAELMAAAALTAKTIDGKMPMLFGRLPRLSYGVREIPAETAEGTTTAYYQPGSPESGIAGIYYVNTSKLDQRPLWELPALTLHESVPGHHNQIALQQEMTLRSFRKYAADFTAYIEGWGLYAEHLGIELGMYDTPEKVMGRLSYEMWRACRLVVDTGLHAKGWSKAQAVAFMRENTALTDANIDAEVNRYISLPGQALAYKIGELKLKELRARAERALGPRFDVRAFHDVVLAQGAVPLDVLESQVDAWIGAGAADQRSSPE